MSTIAVKFIEELKAGKISEAIETIKSGLQESQTKLVAEKRQQVLESYGFKVVENKENVDDNKSDDNDDDKDNDDNDDDDKDNDDNDKSDDKEDE